MSEQEADYLSRTIIQAFQSLHFHGSKRWWCY